MTQSLSSRQTDQLRQCLSLAQDPAQHSHASQSFAALRDSIAQQPEALELLQTLWDEMLAARRSALFWQKISDVEKEMTEKLAQNHFQLQQNYLRLIQEQ